MKRTFLTAFALLSFMNFASQADDKPVVDSTSVRHLNLNEVQINASRVNAKVKNLPQKVDVITPRMIKTSPATDVAGLLKRSSSIDILQYPGVDAGIGIRGFSADTQSKYALILIDGKPAGTENLASIDLSNVERVEILKGPFSAQYGSDAMGGVVNIVSKSRTGKLGGSASLAYGSFQNSKVNLNVGGSLSELLDFDLGYTFHKQNKDYKVGNHNLYNEAYAKTILDATTYGARMENSQFEKHNVNARLGIKFAEDWKLNLNSSFYQALNVETPGNFWHTYGMDSKDIKRYTGGFDVLGKAGIHSLRLSSFLSKENTETIDLGNDGSGNLEKIYKNYGFQLNDAFQIDEHTFAFGIDNRTDKYESLNYTKEGTAEAPYKPDYNNRKTGVFGQIQFKLLDGKLDASIGGRGDFIKFDLEADKFLGNASSSETYEIFTKNLGLKYELCEHISIHSSWGDAFLAPDAFQVAGFYTVASGTTTRGNANLKAEKSKTFDIGESYKDFQNGINIDFTYFQTRHTNKIIKELRDPDGIKKSGDEFYTYINADKANMSGIELLASYDFGALSDYDYSLRLYLNYTHLIDATLKYESNGKPAEGSMRYVRDNTASFGLEFDNLKGFTTCLNGRYIGHRYEDNYMYLADYSNWPNVSKKPIVFNGKEVRPELIDEALLRHPISYVFDYSASYTFKEKYTVGITVSNLLDENYTEKDGYNMPGRLVNAEFIYKF
ncbi:TonB-dependent receptor [Ancylomarina salipaludis]|uniref:TonB-dependent receptor n=1 Tax=Ancylomarina salipaludis TaxID=2501299 RepID=A0A4Q1JJR7_9BACT|nr:TonB-dependent receptor [Ancylomarina salipaludis]RXQ91523.1 TonB-dependent receptor [Ancylomarina salipaludis]